MSAPHLKAACDGASQTQSVYVLSESSQREPEIVFFKTDGKLQFFTFTHTIEVPKSTQDSDAIQQAVGGPLVDSPLVMIRIPSKVWQPVQTLDQDHGNAQPAQGTHYNKFSGDENRPHNYIRPQRFAEHLRRHHQCV